ncbi:Bifunctional glutamine synthetase adenylyltransferase/adenylyl-removing enzyme [Methylophilaceae bacterium]|nr:Bifunctional glutamine synthetase adenylyltransferase/adenylyl-removing enzyme [Methylophilaceae bacterium]
MRTLSEILEDETTDDPDESGLRHAMQCSPFIKRLLTRDEMLLSEILQNLHVPMSEQDMRDWLAAQPVTDEAGLKRVLRKLRQRAMLRVITRDLNGLADLNEVMRTVSHLAEVTVQVALQYHSGWLEALYGKPLSENGEPQALIVVGMGKLGGRELNVSSDIDLIFAFEEDGATDGDRQLSNLDFFTRLGKKLIAAIDEVTEDGFVFRVDMRLRPYGSEGPLACSFAMLEEYYQNQGREWERYAWIKGRVIAGPGRELSAMLRPFVFRKYLDFGAFASMRDLKIQIQRDVNRRDMHDNIKLGRGGIREIEFIAQVFQLIRGGQDASLQIKPTMDVLGLLRNKGLLPGEAVLELTEAYVFLRNLEHRLQYVEDAQTQELPTSPEARARIALAMGFDGWDALHAVLETHRGRVERHFREVFSEPESEENEPGRNQAADIWQGAVDEQGAVQYLRQLGFAEAAETLRRLNSLHQSSRYKQLPELSRQRFDALMPAAILQSASQDNPEATLMRVGDLLDGICRRASYLALLAEYPDALSLLIKLASASPWLIQYLSQHPVLLDELLDTRNLYAEPDFAEMRTELYRRLADVPGDIERQMDIMRDFKHASIFRFAVKDVIGELTLEKLSDYLSELADLILQATIDTVWPNLKVKHRDQPKFAVIGYGKLGGKELGYASDLDIIFLYDDDAPEAGDVYARLGQRINNWLSSLTSAGILYETDLALRPDGASGLLVSEIGVFRDYQENKAWLWEHQALTRARFCAGDKTIGKTFEQIRDSVIRQSRDVEQLRHEVVAMREKMLSSHPNKSGQFDLKHDRGGIIDVEFMVQYLILAHAHEHPALTANIGNIALLEKLGGLGLIDAGQATEVAAAYRQYRTLQHALKLQGENKARVHPDEVMQQASAVARLWHDLFG